MDLEEKMKSNWKNPIIFLFGIIIFLVIIYFAMKSSNVNNEADNYISPIETTIFSFEINETGRFIDGEILINDASVGFTKEGKISMPLLKTIPENFTFKGEYEGAPFEFYFKFPKYYKDHLVIKFNVLRKDLEEFFLYHKFDKEDNFSSSEEIHFMHLPITYSININAAPYKTSLSTRESYYVYSMRADIKKDDIRNAFRLIENATNGTVKFKEIDNLNNSDIKIVGVTQDMLKEYLNYSSESDFTTLGLSRISKKIDNRIIKSDIFFIGEQTYLNEINWAGWRCTDFPVVEIHEILHALGFGHVFDSNNKIMFPLETAKCDIYKIDEDIINCLKRIYSNDQMLGNCSSLNIYPYEKEELNFTINDFLWGALPISYSISNCSENERRKIKDAIFKFESTSKMQFFRPIENATPDVNFICKKNVEEILQTFITDYWADTNYPAISKEFIFDENNKITHAEIGIFESPNCLGYEGTDMELLAIYRAIGIENEYGSDTKSSVVCRTMALSSVTLDKIKSLYSFFY